MIKETKRDIAERALLERFREIRSYSPQESDLVGKYKDGTFAVSSLGFALYSNGYNVRGKSSNHPYGLKYHDGETLFSIGYYRKEYDPPNGEGYLFFVAPRGNQTTTKIKELTDQILGDPEIPCKGIYVRFLRLEQYK